MKYAYPAIFRPGDPGGYWVEFPDLEGCCTCGDTLPGAIEMAEDALCLFLYDMEERAVPAPPPSDLGAVQAEEGAIVSLVACDTLVYQKLYNSKAVKKTLTIPTYLNTLAERADINFSGVLQEALKARLGIE